MLKQIPNEIRDDIRQRVVRAHASGEKLSVDGLYASLLGKYGKGSIGRTTSYKWMREAQEHTKGSETPEPFWDPSPLSWPSDVYPFLLALDRCCVEVVPLSNDVMDEWPSRRLLAREANWASHLLGTLGTATIADARSLISELAVRESVAEKYDEAPELTDIVGYLQYRPWESRENAQAYQFACEQGLVPRYPSLRWWEQDLPEKGRTV